jgi:endopeptidase La
MDLSQTYTESEVLSEFKLNNNLKKRKLNTHCYFNNDGNNDGNNINNINKKHKLSNTHIKYIYDDIEDDEYTNINQQYNWTYINGLNDGSNACTGTSFGSGSGSGSGFNGGSGSGSGFNGGSGSGSGSGFNGGSGSGDNQDSSEDSEDDPDYNEDEDADADDYEDGYVDEDDCEDDCEDEQDYEFSLNYNPIFTNDTKSSKIDYDEVALDTLKRIRNEHPKESVKEIINKYKKEISNFDYVTGSEQFDNMLDKYSKSFNNVYNKINKEYNSKKEKLNIIMWVNDELKKRKSSNNYNQNNQNNQNNLNDLNDLNDLNNNLIFTILLSDPYTNDGIPDKKCKKENATDAELTKQFNELYQQDNGAKSGSDYFKSLVTKDKQHYVDKLKEIKNYDGATDNKPSMSKVIEWNTTNANKSIILSKINTYENLRGSSEFFKLKSWISKVMKVPFGKYIKPPVEKTDKPENIRKYLQKVRSSLDEDIYGHETTKQQLVKILAHTIANPEEGGNVFALQGPPGVGKTALIQDGISKALGRPFTFISLGGATDACFLEGHDYTYEGSNHGRIIDLLHQSGCMNPIIYFDELDKVSGTSKGEEIINILMHITDSTQNSHFNDKYFGGIDFDLSKAIIIFSFNDEHKISRILRDRMKIIRVKGYKMLDKVNIARDYLLPKLYKQIGLTDISISLSDEMLEYIIDTYTNEGGVRKLKETLNDILLEVNLRKLEDTTIMGQKIKNNLAITKEMIDEDFLKKKRKVEHIQINSKPSVGIVNGLWANDFGIGGLIPIECCWIPAKEKLELELTGMQGQVMKESMSVSRTIAWRILPERIKQSLNEKWSKSFDYGIHIHCPDGSTPKDGPSAGGAITTCLISQLANIPVNNKIAMTGEINLKGHITAIGGLEEKMFGAKRAGAELVLCPKENKKDLDEIIEKFPTLFNENFKARTVESIWEILDLVLVTKLDYLKF